MVFNKSKAPVTLQDWEKKLQNAKCPQDFLGVLTSDLSTTEKLIVMFKSTYGKGIPDTLLKNILENEKLDCQVEGAGYPEIARALRLFVYNRYSRKHSDMGWCHAVIEADTESRWIVQREIYIKEELQALCKALELSPSTDRDTGGIEHQIESYEKQINDLNRKYWDQLRKVGFLEANQPGGILKRAFALWRRNPDWYLSDWLRQDCARRGGCCGRDCGCCEKSRVTHRKPDRGHCTTGCGCCIRTRQLADDIELSDTKDFPFDITTMSTTYSRRIYRAYIWGAEAVEDEYERFTSITTRMCKLVSTQS